MRTIQPITKTQAARLRAIWDKVLTSQEREDIRRLLRFLETAPAAADPDQFVSPLSRGLMAAGRRTKARKQ